MGSPFFIALLFSIGAGGWLYSVFVRRSGGGNNKPAIIGAIVSALILFLVLFLTLNVVFK